MVTTEKRIKEMKEELLKGNWINLQEVAFTFENDEERDKWTTANNDYWHARLNDFNYNGAGPRILNLDTMTLNDGDISDIWKAKQRLKNNEILVECSCWEIQALFYKIEGKEFMNL